MAKIRNVEAVLDLTGVATKYHPLFRESVKDLVKVLESHHWDEAWKALYKTSNKWEGELNKKLKPLGPEKVALILFSRGPQKEVDADGVPKYKIYLDLNTYYTIRSVIGYGVASNDEIYVNTKYLSAYTADDRNDRKRVSSNLAHEEAHNCGCDHDYEATAKRKHSLAYLHNDALEIAWDKVFKVGYDHGTALGTRPPATAPVDEPVKPTTPVPPEVITNPNPVTKKKYCKPWYDVSWWINPSSRCYYK